MNCAGQGKIERSNWWGNNLCICLFKWALYKCHCVLVKTLWNSTREPISKNEKLSAGRGEAKKKKGEKTIRKGEDRRDSHWVLSRCLRGSKGGKEKYVGQFRGTEGVVEPQSQINRPVKTQAIRERFVTLQPFVFWSAELCVEQWNPSAGVSSYCSLSLWMFLFCPIHCLKHRYNIYISDSKQHYWAAHSYYYKEKMDFAVSST